MAQTDFSDFVERLRAGQSITCHDIDRYPWAPSEMPPMPTVEQLMADLQGESR